MPDWLSDLLIFVLVTAAVFYAICLNIVWVLRVYSMRKLKGPFRRFGIKQVREMLKRSVETGETSPELERMMDEMREMGCGGSIQIRYPPYWVLNFTSLLIGLLTAWLVVYA